MRKLLVFTGRPGSGKTVLIIKFLEKHQDFKSVDVYNYIRILKDKYGKVPEEIIIRAYKQYYKEISQITDNLILEIGTNYPGYNLHQLAKLSKNFKISLFLCQLDIETCKKRCLARADVDTGKDFKGKSLELRLKRAFPDIHQKLADKLNIPYYEIDMTLPSKERLALIEDIICN